MAGEGLAPSPAYNNYHYMKHFNIFALLLLFVAASCSDDDDATFFSQSDFTDVSYNGSVLEIDINTPGEWTATSRVAWCQAITKYDEGKGKGTVKIKVDPNLEEARAGVVKIWTPERVYDINIAQEARPAGNEHGYTLPVIFHVFYSDESDPTQYVSAERIAQVLQNVNNLYDGGTRYEGGDATQDMNLDFVLATTNEADEPLATPGVEYIKVDEISIDCHTFMGDKNRVGLLWNPNEYINVMLYHFEQANDGGGTILGVSHMPYNAKNGTKLEGLSNASADYLVKENLAYPHCVSINSVFINEEKTPDDAYVGTDVNVTLAHELGHYIGLHHAFDEDEDGSLSTDCIDSDYCKDTPSYNRPAYLMNLEAMMQEAEEQGIALTMAQVTERENCKTGTTFNSYNLMDYDISYADRFTADQRFRIRHVLENSPLIPGPKKSIATRAAVKGIIDLPMRIVE